jgi:hypothetical protein
MPTAARFGRSRAETFRRHHHAVVRFVPATPARRIGEALLLNEQDIVELPERALVILDRPSAEWNDVAEMRVRKRSTRQR